MATAATAATALLVFPVMAPMGVRLWGDPRYRSLFSLCRKTASRVKTASRIMVNRIVIKLVGSMGD